MLRNYQAIYLIKGKKQEKMKNPKMHLLFKLINLILIIINRIIVNKKIKAINFINRLFKKNLLIKNLIKMMRLIIIITKQIITIIRMIW